MVTCAVSRSAMSIQQNYTFGDSDRAIQRLGLLAEVFAPSSQRLLDRLSRIEGVALDLGCGPGYTTELVHQRLAPTSTVGLDSSARMVELARARTQPPLTFVEHGVTVLPLPAAPAALIYARFLLTHLNQPGQRVRDWASALAPGGRLVLEETAFMRSEHAVFQSYYEHVQTLQAHYGQDMLIGGRLAALFRSGAHT
jgi:trans-aconitate 2-methyltransferase